MERRRAVSGSFVPPFHPKLQTSKEPKRLFAHHHTTPRRKIKAPTTPQRSQPVRRSFSCIDSPPSDEPQSLNDPSQNVAKSHLQQPSQQPSQQAPLTPGPDPPPYDLRLLDMTVANISPPQPPRRTRNQLLQHTELGNPSARNPLWAGVPWRVLRKQRYFISAPPSALPSNIKDLRLLRADSPALSTVSSAFPNAAWVARALGIGGVLAVTRAWAAARTSRPKPASFEDQFADAHLAGGVGAYAAARKRRYVRGTGRNNEAVRVVERGLLVGQVGEWCVGIRVAGLVAERQQSDFWSWGKTNGLLFVRVEPSFVRDEWCLTKLTLSNATARLDAEGWVEAQMGLVCAGEWAEWADVVSYAVYGGVRVFRVERDTRFAALVEEGITMLMKEVGNGSAPDARYLERRVVKEMKRVAEQGCEAARVVEEEDADQCEAWVERLRDEMEEKDNRRAAPAFSARSSVHDGA